MQDTEKIIAALEVATAKVVGRDIRRLEELVQMVFDQHHEYSRRLDRLESELPEKCSECGRRG